MRFARTGSRAPRVVFALMVMLAATGARMPTALAQDDQARFAEFVAARDASARLAGPDSGELIQTDGFSVTAGAGLSVADFSATATFVNPSVGNEDAWDFGFSFHSTPEAAQQVVVDSTGVWYFSPFPEGTLESGFVPTFDAAPGGTNTIDLVVEGGTALVGVNGELLVSLELPAAIAADVLVGSGYFTNTTQEGRAIAYRDFEVWAPPSGSPPEPTGQQAAQITVDPTPAISASDAEAFAMILGAQSRVEPLAGPFTANLTEEVDRIALSWANVDLTDFHAQATFAVPEATTDVPWDIGFMFRASPNGTLRVAVDSDGNWYYAVGSASPAAFGRVSGLATEPGGTNTLDLIVANERAVLGVNGAFAAAIDLSPDSSAADVAAGAAFFTDQTLPERVTPFRGFVVLPFDPGAVSVTEPSPSDADDFAGLLAETARVTPLVGPLAGRLVESAPGTAPLAAAGVALADFGTVAAFITPANVVDGLWDAGFQFRGDENVTHRLAMGFNGEVYAVLPGESPRIVGTATTFDATPGAANALQLFVENGRALVGVNGEFIAAIDLAAPPFAADVLVGAAFFDEDFVQDRVTAYEDFRIWEIT